MTLKQPPIYLPFHHHQPTSQKKKQETLVVIVVATAALKVYEYIFIMGEEEVEMLMLEMKGYYIRTK